jgi:Domain of unknown function (DUF4249)
MKKHSFLYIIVIACFALTSCEKVINVDLKNAGSKIVINAIVDNSGNPAEVSINQTVAFSAGNTYPPITGAAVKITDNTGNVFTLTEATPGIYRNALLKGIPGKSYTLSVISAGKTYTATCKMPDPVNLDSVFQDKATFTTKPFIIVKAAFKDPVGFGNSYQFVETVNGKRNKTLFIIDDFYLDGGEIENELIDEDIKLKAGDNVQIEMQCVDKTVFRYLRGLEDLNGNNTVPANPDSNISNDALGFFSAHTSQRKSLTIK